MKDIKKERDDPIKKPIVDNLIKKYVSFYAAELQLLIAEDPTNGGHSKSPPK